MIEYQLCPYCLFVLMAASILIGYVSKVQYSSHVRKLSALDIEKHAGVVGWCEGVMYLVSPGRPTDIGLQLGKACYC